MSITYGGASGSGLSSFNAKVSDDLFTWMQVNSDQTTEINTGNNTLELQQKAVGQNTVLAGSVTDIDFPSFRLLEISDLPTLQLHANYTDVTSVGGVSTTFDTFNLPTRTYNNDGHVVNAQYGGSLPFQIATYTLNFVGVLDGVNPFNFSSITIVSPSVLTGSWNITVNTMRISSTKVRTLSTLNVSVGAINNTYSQYTELTISGGFSSALTMALTCQTNVTGIAVFKYANVVNQI